nr:hypothetical protein BaRGS_010902 [Batillaria attramentaria]
MACQDGIVRVMQKEAGPSSKEITEPSELDKFLSKESAAVVGFFTDADSSLAKTFQKVADTTDDMRFAHTVAKSVLDKYDYKDEIVLFRPKAMQNKFEESAVKFPDSPSHGNIKLFLEKEQMDKFEQFVRDVLDQKLDPYLKSEPVPDNDQPLKVGIANQECTLQSGREVDDFIKYLARESTNELQGWDRKGKKKGGKKKKTEL